MEKLQHDTLKRQLNWRYAVKKFDATKKIAAADWAMLEEALLLSPSSYGLQPWRFLVVQKPELRRQLTPASYGQQQIEACSHLVVVTALRELDAAYVTRYIKHIAKVRAMDEGHLKAYNDTMVGMIVKGMPATAQAEWSAKQTYLAMGSFMTVAALLHIDVCPMEGIDRAKYDEVLGLDGTKYTTVATLAAGYRAADDAMQHAKKVRFDRADLIEWR